MEKSEDSTNTRYISSACNCVPHCADWARDGLIVYGACNAVVLHDPDNLKRGKTLKTFCKSKDKINVVKWLRHGVKVEEEFVSGSNDGGVNIWRKKSNDNSDFDCFNSIEVNDPVGVIAGTYTNRSELLLYVGCINGTSKLILRQSEADIVSKVLLLNQKLPLEAAFSRLPSSSKLALAIALEDNTVQIYIQQSEVLGSEVDCWFAKVQVLIGHEDWVRCMDFMTHNNCLYLATGAQDNFVRIWKFYEKEDTTDDNQDLKQTLQEFIVDNVKYTIELESVLFSHEAWIYGVQWQPAEMKDGAVTQELKLLTSSFDKSMIIWQPDLQSGIWQETIRVGDVGGNSLGFFGCKFGPGGKSIMGYSYRGSFHLWTYNEGSKQWSPRTAPGGHYEEVADLCWDPRGRFLVTVSTDQTTRVHAPWKSGSEETWHEIARPQIHGHDLSCIAMLSPRIFASGSNEKVVRIFTAPTNFVNYLQVISNADDFADINVQSASVPALGLTNKAVVNGDTSCEETLYPVQSNLQNFSEPPVEEELIKHTLWPELQKLYGHGYEIFTMASRSDGSKLATACKSNSPEYSAIIVWCTSSWSSVQKLFAHKLTVTQLAFSPNDKYLVSVSRDRRWSLAEFDEQLNTYNQVAASGKQDTLHARIIWCCAWSHDSKYFATGSRDGKVGIWNCEVRGNENVKCTTSHQCKESSFTALAFAPVLFEECHILAIGHESGLIEVQKIRVNVEGESTWTRIASLNREAHHLTVTRLMFRPLENATNQNTLQLASCGSDHFVKVHDIFLK